MNARRMRRFAAVLLAAVATWICASAAHAKEDPKSRLAKAEAMFAERCKKSGEFIHRTAESVEGVLLMKVRMSHNHGDQYRMSDPYGHDSTGTEYVKEFLYGRNENGYLTLNAPIASLGYRYAEAIDEQDGKRYHYTGGMKDVTRTTSILAGGDGRTQFTSREFVLDKTPALGPIPRYGVTYEDISTREDRDYWIAGSSLRVIDLQTNEVMAERVGYMMDRGQGNKSGGRSPWLLAARNACPSFPVNSGHAEQVGQTRNLVERVLKPIQEKKP